MPDPKYSSSDVPEFSTYPAPDHELPEHGTESREEYARYRRSQYDRYARGQTALDESARKIGWTIGRIIGSVEEIADRARERFSDAQENLKEQISDAPDEARRKLDDASNRAQRKLNELRYNAARLRHRAVRDYPVQVILAAGAMGVLLGAGLRAWRENRG
jgi:ElaB/YqjD/DUF883 family membrane-anchored ribosome-binding protein